MKELAYLNKYLLKYKYKLALGFVFVALSSVFAIIPAQMVRHALDLVVEYVNLYPLVKGGPLTEVFNSSFYFSVLVYGVLIVAMAFIRGGFLYLMRQTIIVVSRLIEYDLKNEIYQHYQSLPLSFYRRNNTGDLMSRISEDVSRVRMYLGPAIMYGINLSVTMVLTIGYMLTVNVPLTLYSLLPMPFLALSIYYVNNLIQKRSEEIQQTLSGMSTFAQESFSGIRVLKSFVREEHALNQFGQLGTTYKERSLRLAMVNALFMPLIQVLIALSTILTVYIGGIEVMNGAITTGNIAEFIIYVNMLTWPVTSLGWITSIIQRAEASQKRINEFLKTKTDLVSQANLRPAQVKGDLRFEAVEMVYPDSGIKALEEVSFEVKDGEALAILGATGSGKSTIANLVCRMLDPTAGRILLDGQDLKNYDLSFLRSRIGYVPQDVFMFSESIRNNIAFGADHFDEDEILQASRDADLYENVMGFPRQFDTVVGERGITLSGGQKQRASIARAVIRKPDILILDDCLSAVDTRTENAILQNLARIMQGRTSIIISHRVSSARLANRIVILDKGRIAESGTHPELMQQNGLYRELYEKQLKGEQEVEI